MKYTLKYSLVFWLGLLHITCSCTAQFAGLESDVMEFMQNNVRTFQKYRKGLVFKYEYTPHKIIETAKCEDFDVERHYYHSKKRLDSILIIDYMVDSIFSKYATYHYNGNQLTKIIFTKETLLSNEFFTYNAQNQLDTIFYYKQKSYQDKDTLILKGYKIFHYNLEGNCTHLTWFSPNSLGTHGCSFYEKGLSYGTFYWNSKSRPTRKEEDRWVSCTKWKYHDSGLEKSYKIREYILSPNGKMKRRGKLKRRYRYEFYK